MASTGINSRQKDVKNSPNKTRQKAVINSPCIRESEPISQQWYQSPRSDRWEGIARQGNQKSVRKGRNNGAVRKLHQMRKVQCFKRNFELANLLRNWNIGGEITEKRNRKATCYRCKERGHFAWNCPKRVYRNTQEENSNLYNEFVRGITPSQPYHQTYVERIIINGDYLVEGTDKETWNKIWYVNTKISKHMTPNRDLMVIFKGGFYQ